MTSTRPNGAVVILGTRMPGKNGRYVLNSYLMDRGLSSPLIPVLDAELGPVLHDLATYVELMNVDAVTPDLWQESGACRTIIFATRR